MSSECRITVNSIADQNDDDYNKKSLMEKWRDRYNDTERNRRRKKNIRRLMQLSVAVHGPAQMYILVTYVVPYLWFDHDPWVQYWLKVLFSYVSLMAYMNYFLTLFYSSEFQPGRDRPYFRCHRNQNGAMPETYTSVWSDLNSTNGSCNGLADRQISKQMSPENWKYCDKCKQFIPPRAHHCDVCRSCVLKRDHHCYVVGTCIGHYNQRYFVMMTFYGMITGLCCIFYIKYIYEFFYPNSYSFLDFFLPVSVIRWLFGTSQHLSLHLVVMIAQIHLQLVFTLFGFLYFNFQIFIILQDKTNYEVVKQVPVRSFNSLNQKFRSVFGDLWALNFFFPLQIILRQPNDGTTWPGVTIGQGNSKTT